MSYDRGQLAEMLSAAASMPYGQARTRHVEDAVRHADAQGFSDVSFSGRLALIEAYQFGGETAKMFVPFSWCLAAYDRDPSRCTFSDRYHLFWQFKWVAGALAHFPEVPLPQTRQMLDDMERRYREAGHSQQAVYGRRCRVASHVGDLDAAAEWYRKWCAAPRDTFSDCEACDVAGKIWYLLRSGPDDAARDAEAVAMAAPVVSGDHRCEVEPQTLFAGLMLPYLRLGRLDDARDAHRWYRKVRDSHHYLATVGRHIEFCALTGNEARGLEILQRHLDWYDRPPDTASLLTATGTGALLLRRLCAGGHGGKTVHRSGAGDRPAADVEVAALADEMERQATDLAARFDARNGTDWQSQLLRRRLTAEPVTDYLPLSATARRRRATPPPAAPGATGAAGVPADDLAGSTPQQLLDLGEERYAAQQPHAAVAAWRRYDEVAGGDVDPSLAARRIDARGLEAAIAEDLTAAEAHWQDAAGRYAALGDEVRRHATLGRIGQIRCLTGRTDEGFPLVVASADYLREHGRDELRCNAELRLAQVQHEAGDVAAARAALDRAEAVATSEVQRAAVYLERALLLGNAGDHAEAATAAGAARQAFRAAGVRDRLGQASFLHAKLLERSDVEGAVAAYDEALANAPEDKPLAVAGARASRGALLAGAERFDDAIDDLIEAVGIFTEHGAPDAAYARFDLAVAYRDADRLFDAAEVAEEALAAFAAGEDAETTERCRYLLAHLYRGLAEHDQALVQLDLLVEALATTGRPAAAAQMHEDAGEVLDTLDRDAAAAARFGLAAGIFSETGQVSDELRCRRRQALSLHWAGEPADGLATVTGADVTLDQLAADVPAAAIAWERAANDYTAARILVGMQRYDEAAARAEQAVAGFRQADASDDASQAEALVTDIREYRESSDEGSDDE